MIRHALCLLLAVLPVSTLFAKAAEDTPLSAKTFKGLELRGIGPALMSGRIAHIEFEPGDPATWYVAVGSGGVWKTVNAGTTWTPIFDAEQAYSIGTVAIDPSNTATLYVGTGEDVGGRHVGYGNGVYRSRDGGANWENIGLEKSEHIARILVHPTEPDTLYVAAQGPLWSKGGERGFYRTEDGGKTWQRTLGDEAWTGVTDLVMDPRNPDHLYAATWQRHRTVANYVGGGPNSGIHRSTDGGKTWTELTQGLPEGNMGKIGLAISPHDPDTVYAAIELDRRRGGIWRSSDRGATWEKRSDTVSGGTGPHYYQELYASPHHKGRIYLMSNTTMISHDGGATFVPLNNEHKHVDDHAIAFHPTDPDYVMIGSDGGLYESHDDTRTWRYIANLPVTQFYKVAVDDAEPFYNIYGGTQDNNTQGGPSRTDNVHGIRNSDWFITLFGDGHQPATEPGNPDIVYSHWQQGNLVRYDRRTGEIVYLQPQPRAGEPAERFNWDAPILVSPHAPTRLYHASQRVWRSDDRGDTWTPISGDLTRNEERVKLPVMGRQQSWDAPWDMYAMSYFNSITSLAESPLQAGLLYAGTDDGLIQVSEDGGANWRRIEVSKLPGVPARAFVNDIKADLHDADTVYVALDNHKEGDFKPYLLKSTDRGRSWRSISGDLPARHLVWRVVQDHVKPELLFAATEFGIFFSPDAGARWIELEGGVPTIAFRDLAIQKRENDLVGASFGRGFYVLDDYSALRQVDDALLQREAALFAPRRAWWYIPRTPMGSGEKASQGHAFYTAPNPDFGAIFTYYLKDGLDTRKQRRQKQEKPLIEKGEDTPFPGWAAIEAEQQEADPAILLTIRDSSGEVIRRISNAPTGKGFQRVSWDLRTPPTQAIGTQGDYFQPELQGFLVAPGTYSAELSKRVDGQITPLAGPVEVKVERMRTGTLPGAEPEAVVAFWGRIDNLQRKSTALAQALPRLQERVTQLGQALDRTRSAPAALDAEFDTLRRQVYALNRALYGTPESAEAVGHLRAPGLSERLTMAQIGTQFSTYGPTPSHEQSMALAEQAYQQIRADWVELTERRIPAFERSLVEAGAPWVPGMPLSILE
jgi:photosystem II stability/assembly factor-like uncharacterized protein